MIDARLFFANLLRWRLLTAITVTTVVVAFFLFSLLLALDRVFAVGVTVDKADRLVVANAQSLMQSLPSSYGEILADNKEITAVAPTVFFGGFYQDVANAMMSLATDPAQFIKIVPEAQFRNKADLNRWIEDPATIAVGRSLANKYGWRVGDLVPLYSFLHQKKDGSNSWTFRVAAIYDGEDSSSNTNSLLLHYSYLNQNRLHGADMVGWYNIRLRDAYAADRVAAAIDAEFANSPYETKTASEAAFAHELINQVGDFSTIVRTASLAVFFTLILVVANAMGHSVSERLDEFATLKTLGATGARLFRYVILEGIAIVVTGAVLGAVVAYFAIPRIAAWSTTLASIAVAPIDYLWIAIAAVIVGFVVAAGPAYQVMRVELAKGLRRSA